MATTESIRRAVDQLVALALEAECFANVCSDLAAYDINQPPWVFAVAQQMRRIRAATTAVEIVVNREVIPALESEQPGQQSAARADRSEGLS